MNRRFAAAARLAVVLWAIAAVPVASGQESLRRDVAGALLEAFRGVIRPAAQSTVQVYSNNMRACFGAIVRADGHIATKASELKGEIKVRLPGDREDAKRQARIVAVDTPTDLAILKIDASDLPVVPWSNEESPPVGTWLATLGLSTSPVSIGVVSVAARRIPSDAALGVLLDDADGMARIMSVRPGLAADKAGLKDGDVVRKCDGAEITSRLQFQQAIRSHLPGEKIALVVEREGTTVNIEATLGSMNDIYHDERADFQNSLGGQLSQRRTNFPLAIQHDSVLRPSECGGPVVDIDGKVVGLNIARAGRVESYALPASLVRETVDKLISTELTSAAAGQEKAARTTTPQGHER